MLLGVLDSINESINVEKCWIIVLFLWLPLYYTIQTLDKRFELLITNRKVEGDVVTFIELVQRSHSSHRHRTRQYQVISRMDITSQSNVRWRFDIKRSKSLRPHLAVVLKNQLDYKWANIVPVGPCTWFLGLVFIVLLDLDSESWNCDINLFSIYFRKFSNISETFFSNLSNPFETFWILPNHHSWSAEVSTP